MKTVPPFLGRPPKGRLGVIVANAAIGWYPPNPDGPVMEFPNGRGIAVFPAARNNEPLRLAPKRRGAARAAAQPSFLRM